MPVAAMNEVEIEVEIAKMDGDLLSQLLKCNVSPLNIATLSKACPSPSLRNIKQGNVYYTLG
jgi:hypothetical protein